MNNTTIKVGVDAGLRSYMLTVYNYMLGGLALTGAVALMVASSPALLKAIFGSGLGIVVMLAPLAFILVLSFGINKLSLPAAQGLFWAFAAVMGLSLSSIFIAYTGASIARVFFITSATFGAMSIYGYTTKRDLTAMGSFLVMGLIGLILATLVNLFLKSTGLDLLLSIGGVIIFTLLIAFDTQRLKAMYYNTNANSDVARKYAILGALSLYLDFINLFMYLLRLMGDRR